MKQIRTMVLGVDTEIGKTYVSCALIEAARRKGLRPRAFKPVMSGFRLKELAASDAGLLAAACGEKLTPDNFRDYCHAGFEEAISPNIAARRLARQLDYKALLMAARRAMTDGAAFTLIEGAGGVLTPLTDTHLNADLAANLNMPVVLVTANYLGAISHTLTAIEACERRRIRIAAIAVSQPAHDFAAPAGLIDELARWRPIPLFSFPYADGVQRPDKDKAQQSAAGIIGQLQTAGA